MTSNTPELTKDFLFREFLAPLPGQEAEFERWNEEQHLKDVVATPGFLSARRYVLADGQVNGSGAAKPKYMNTYHIRAEDPQAAKAEYDRLQASGEIALSPTVDPASIETYTYHLLKKSFTGSAGLSAMDPGQPDYLEQIFDDPKDGQDDALNAWYDEEMQALMANPAVINAYRGLWSDLQFGPVKQGSKYFAQLAFRAPDLAAFAASVDKFGASPVADAAKGSRYTYKAAGGYVMGGKVREERAAK